MPGIELRPADVETNIIIFGFSHPRLSAFSFLDEMRKRNVLALATAGGIRFVTHKDIDDEDVERAVTAFGELLA
jgi:threonine aldolase